MILCGRVGVFFVLFAFFLALQPALAAQKEVAQGLKKTLENFDDAFYALKKERDALREEMLMLKKEHGYEISDLEAKIEALKQEKQEIQQSLDQAQDKILDIEEEKSKLMEKLEDSKVGSAKIDDIINAKDSYIEQLKSQKQELSLSRAQAEDALVRASDRIQRLQEDKESLSAQIDSLLEERENIVQNYMGVKLSK